MIMRRLSVFSFLVFVALCLFAQDKDVAVADTIVKYQMPSGGWPKNQKWAEGVDADYMRRCRETGVGSTIDNGATTTEMRLLAEVYGKTHNKKYLESFMRGLDYLTKMQYDNGGWPQFFPVRKAAPYSSHITFNDNAMTNVMRMLKTVVLGGKPYDCIRLPRSVRRKMTQSYFKGVKCILDCQVRCGEDSVLTVWCQQHDEYTLKPANARAYELASLTGHGETVDIILLLRETLKEVYLWKQSRMSDSEQATLRNLIRHSIDAALSWLEAHAIHDMRIERFVNEEGLSDIRLVSAPGAPRLWARYYDLETQQPYYCDRDGIPQLRLENIGYERRNGYSWIGSSPERLFDK